MKEYKHLDTTGKTKSSKLYTTETDTAKADFPIVGIGASAGGLEALIAFLSNVPEQSGLAFVIIQHMEQMRKSILVELLQSATTMKVVQVNEDTSVQPDCVYVIPPNKEMAIQHGVLRLSNFIVPHTLHLPIDFFFLSLADDQQERSIGVILSGWVPTVQRDSERSREKEVLFLSRNRPPLNLMTCLAAPLRQV